MWLCVQCVFLCHFLQSPQVEMATSSQLFRRLAPCVKLQFSTLLYIYLIYISYLFSKLCEYDEIYYTTHTEVNSFSAHKKKAEKKAKEKQKMSVLKEKEVLEDDLYFISWCTVDQWQKALPS